MLLNSSLTDLLRSGSSTSSELLRAFDEMYTSYTGFMKQRQFLNVFLCTATEHNHIDVVTHLLSHPRCSLDIVMNCLLLAIHANSLELVDVILRLKTDIKLSLRHLVALPHKKTRMSAIAFSSKDEREERKCRETSSSKKSEQLTVTEYACLCYRPQILKLLVAYDKKKNRCKCNNASHHVDDEITPLHAVVKFVQNGSFRDTLKLPAIIRLMVEAGVDVNALYENRTALNLLVQEVVRSININYGAGERRMLTEALRVLLTSGSVTTGPLGSVPLDTLLELALPSSGFSLPFTSVFKHDCFNKMIDGMIKLLLVHGALPMHALLRMDLLTRILRESCACDNPYNRRNGIYDSTMDRMADLFYYFTLAEPDVSKYCLASDGFLLNDPTCEFNQQIFREMFDVAFVKIAGYSSQVGSSDKYVNLLLSRMSAAHVLRLQLRLKETRPVHVFPYIPREMESDLQVARDIVSAVEVPFSLQHLSRRAITRAMSYRCLSARNVAKLNLPKSLREFILPYIVET